jgi:Leucine-rich repeat (LRR) protein
LDLAPWPEVSTRELAIPMAIPRGLSRFKTILKRRAPIKLSSLQDRRTAMGRTDPVPLTRSPAEVSVLNALRSLPDLLLYSRRPSSAKLGDSSVHGRSVVVTSSVTALRSLCGRRQLITEASSRPELGSLERWLALAELSAKLDDDVQNLEREIQTHERKRHVLAAERLDGHSPTALPAAEACELGPKLQCLQEVLGLLRFRAYCRDLFTLVRNLRLRLELYGVRVQDFERQLRRERFVSREKLLWLLNETERCLGRPLDQQDPATTEDSPAIELADYALLFQHCTDPTSPDGAIVTEDVVALLQSIPLERATLVRYVFEQLVDTRRGEGYRPPPDHTRAHHIHAAIKLQRKQCSAEEIQAAEAWLDVMGSDAITLQDLLQFHVTVSDANVSEDAELVRFVQRMWGFDPLAVKDADRGEAILHLLENYSARCNLVNLLARKRELLAKIPSAQARIRSASALLETELQHQRVLHAPAGLSRWLHCDEGIHARLGATFALLRELTLSGQGLTAIPEFAASLTELQVLDLRDNRLATLSATLSAMKSLRKLNLADNLLRDASFAQADELWCQLEALTELRLSGNRLTSLPSALVAIPSLATLDLSANALRAVNGRVVKLWKGRSRLVTLDLHGNSLSALPEEIHVLFGTLRRLLLHQNRLVSLPSAIAELLKLEELSLSQNQLCGESLASYPLAEGNVAISLAQNQLRVLPRLVGVHAEGKGPARTVNTSVRVVDVRGNRLQSLVSWSPRVLATCQALHLQNNALRELPGDFFACLPALRLCELQHNQLRLVPVGVTECTRLQALHLNDNCLQSLPAELAQLATLEVLNAAENDITDIPIEWHAFETQGDGARVLHSLLLRRNPLRNKILKAIVDGSTDGALSAARVHLDATSDDPACEGVIHKLLDGLRDASVVLRDKGGGTATARKAWVDSDEEEGPEHSKWRGVARDVNCYLEQRLRAMQRPGGAAAMLVDVKSFERLIRTLPFTCSKRELAHLVRRFLASEEAEDQPKHRREIDGLAFLQAIERFGRWRSISMASKRPVSSVAKPTIDSAGPIIQYLVVLQRRLQHEQLEAAHRDDHTPRSRSPQRKRKAKLRANQAERARPSRTRGESAAPRKPAPAANQSPPQLEKPHRSRADVMADRQRQRIQVLEQQLVDQKLLLLAHQKPAIGTSGEGHDAAAIAPADLETVPAEDDGSTASRAHDDDRARAVLVSVKCLHLAGTDESEAPGAHQTAGWRSAKAPARLDLRIRPDESVLLLKQELLARTGVPVEHQILVASGAGRGMPAIRLRNSAILREYAAHVGGLSTWSLTLLIGQSLPTCSGDSAT